MPELIKKLNSGLASLHLKLQGLKNCKSLSMINLYVVECLIGFE